MSKVMMMAADRFRLDLEALGSSAAHVNGQGEDLAMAHLSSDNRIVAAQQGWVGSSAAALHTKIATWLHASRRLVTDIGDHVTGLNQDGFAFAAVERERDEALRAILGPGDGVCGPAGADE